MYVGDKKFETVEEWEAAVMTAIGMLKSASPTHRKVRNDVIEVQFQVPQQTPMGMMLSTELYTFWYNKSDKVGRAIRGAFNSAGEKVIK